MEKLRLLSLATSDFAALRLRNQIYVDKSALVFKVASQNGKFLFVRPRRFGKSLLISTFESLYELPRTHVRGFMGARPISSNWRTPTLACRFRTTAGVSTKTPPSSSSSFFEPLIPEFFSADIGCTIDIGIDQMSF